MNMIDTKARTIPKLEALVGAEVEIDGKRFWIYGFDYFSKTGWSIRFSEESPPEWLRK